MTLITRLERAAEGSRELDLLIDMEVRPGEWRGTFEEITTSMDWVTGWEPFEYPPRYTTSLDAAMTLVPEGWAWNAAGYDPHGGQSETEDYRRPHAAVVAEPVEVSFAHDEPPEWQRPFHEARAATPALALCIAALKARNKEPAKS